MFLYANSALCRGFAAFLMVAECLAPDALGAAPVGSSLLPSTFTLEEGDGGGANVNLVAWEGYYNSPASFLVSCFGTF